MMHFAAANAIACLHFTTPVSNVNPKLTKKIDINSSDAANIMQQIKIKNTR